MQEINEWQQYIMDGGKIHSQDGSAINAGALVGKDVQKTVPTMSKKDKIVSQGQIRAINIMRGKHHG